MANIATRKMQTTAAAYIQNKAIATSAEAQARYDRDQAAMAKYAMVPKQKPLQSFILSIFNDHATDAELAVLWNPDTIVTGLSQGADVTTSTVAGPTYANLIKTLGYSPILILGFKYNVSNALQFGRAFTTYKANIDGTRSEESLAAIIQQATNPAYQNDKLLNIPYTGIVSAYTAWTISVLGGDATQILDFLPAMQFRVD